MANLILLIAVVLASTNFLLSYTSYFGATGFVWTEDICWAAPPACQSPQQMNYIAAGLALVWVVMKLVSALRN